MKDKIRPGVIVLMTTAWVLVIGGGMFGLSRYKSSPGLLMPAPAVWPAGSVLPRQPGRSTLIMMSHPRCPCTRASITELKTLLSQFGDRLTAHVLFVQPHGTDHDWTNTDLWKSASQIPGVQVVRDEGGVEAARFDGLTSGTIVLYDAEGRLLFNGGITGARGHVGDNLGLRRIASLLDGTETDRADSPVFGCPLHAENER
jgi:hypothetical protein